MRTPPAAGTYRQSLGQLELVSLGIGGTIGSGIFVVPGIAAGLMGPASLIAWVIVALSATLVMLSLSWVSSRFGRKGTFFTIFSTTFGRKTSTALILLYTVSAIFGVATIAAGIGQYLSYFGIGNLLAIEFVIIAVFCIINLIRISLSGLTENILILLKILPLVIITRVLLPFIRLENLAPTGPFTRYGGSYELVTRKVRQMKEDLSRKAYMRFETEPGRQAQVDFGEFQVEGCNGEIEKYYLF